MAAGGMTRVNGLEAADGSFKCIQRIFSYLKFLVL